MIKTQVMENTHTQNHYHHQQHNENENKNPSTYSATQTSLYRWITIEETSGKNKGDGQ